MAINLTSKKILIVQAHASMRETVKHILGSLGARFIFTAESGIDAISAMKKDKFDLVICDYNLPDKKTGQQILEEAKHLKLLPVNAIFIISTDQHRLEIVLSAVESRPDDYLVKPFSLKQITSLLEKCHIRKEFFSGIEIEIDNGNLFHAIHQCELLLKQDEKSMRLPLLKIYAELALKVGDFKKAKKVYQDILHQRELPWARLGLGIVAFNNDEHKQALSTFQELIKNYPTMLEAHDWLVKVHETMGNLEHAVTSLNTAVTHFVPTSILRQKKLALLADKTANLPIAQKAYSAAIELGKNSIHKSSSDYSGLANIHLKNKAEDKALDVVLKMGQQFKNEHEAKLRAALLETTIYQEKGDERRAKTAYKKTLELNEQPNKQLSKELRLEMAKIFCLNGNREICDQILDDLVKTYIDDKYFIKDIVTMCDTFIGKNYAESLIDPLTKELVDFHNKGADLFRKGNIAGARDIFEQAFTKRPENHKVILNMIKIIIHEIKSSGADPENILRAQNYINKAIEVGIPHEQTSILQTTLDTLKNKINQ